MATTTMTFNVERNPSYLSPRFEIRRLGPEHADWAKSIVLHTNIFNSPVWPVVYPEGQAARCYEGMTTATYLVDHQIESGMSFGVFDTEYKYKRHESAATHGKLYWDLTDISATGDQLLDQMDFPLVSVALAYDQINALDMPKVMEMVSTFPLFGDVYFHLAALDKRDPASWSATTSKQVLMRNATSTRFDYAGHGLMKKLAQFLMREAKLEGYRGVQIETLHDAVNKTWMNPPEPFKGELIAKFNVYEYEKKDDEGNITNPFRPSKQDCTKVYVHL